MTAAVWFVLVYGAVALGSSWWLDRARRGERGDPRAYREVMRNV